MTVETESENLFSGLPQLARSTGTASSVPGMPVDILQQIVLEASAAAKNRPTDV